MKHQKKKNAKAGPVPLFQIRITAMSDMSVRVMGIPSNFNTCMNIMDTAKRLAVMTFIKAAKDNRLSDNLVIDESNLVLPKKGLLVPNRG